MYQVCILLYAYTMNVLQRFDSLVGHQEKRPACKNRVMRCWCGHLRCQLFAYGDAVAVPKPHISCLMSAWTCFTFPVPAYRGCPGKEAVKCVVAYTFLIFLKFNFKQRSD